MTSKELMDIIDKWLMEDDPCAWGSFEIDLYDVLIDHNYYGIDGVHFKDD